MKCTILILMVCIVLAIGGCFGTVRTVKKITKLSDKMMREAVQAILETGAKQAVVSLSQEGGFALNAAVTIKLPDDFTDIAGKLKQVGVETPVDELQAGLNRAAEQALAKAGPILVRIAGNAKPKKAMKILKGKGTDATKFLRREGSGVMRTYLQPSVAESLAGIEAVGKINKLIEKYNSIPLVEKKEVSIETHVIDRILEGFFLALGQAEIGIRKDPKKCGSKVVKEVFKLLK